MQQSKTFPQMNKFPFDQTATTKKDLKCVYFKNNTKWEYAIDSDKGWGVRWKVSDESQLVWSAPGFFPSFVQLPHNQVITQLLSLSH